MPFWRRGAPADERDEEPRTEQEQEILDALASLRTATVRDVMTPRVDVRALAMPVGSEDVANAVRESGHSRFPVYERDLDNLVGILFVKDLFRIGEPLHAAAIARRLRAPFLVPEGRKALEVLQAMRQQRHAFAVVVDEYGGIEGVLTIKDLVAELVGDLHDEFDTDVGPGINRVDPHRWLVDGQVPVDDLRDELGVDVPDGDYVTIAGFLLDQLGRIPEEGDELSHEGWTYRIADMEGRRIAKVVLAPASGSIAANGK